MEVAIDEVFDLHPVLCDVIAQSFIPQIDQPFCPCVDKARGEDIMFFVRRPLGEKALCGLGARSRQLLELRPSATHRR